MVHVAGRTYRDYREAAARYPRWSDIEAFSSAAQVVDMYRDRHAPEIALEIARDRQALHIALDIAISGTTHLTPTAVRTLMAIVDLHKANTTETTAFDGCLPPELVVRFLPQVAFDKNLVRTGVCVYALWLLLSS